MHLAKISTNSSVRGKQNMKLSPYLLLELVPCGGLDKVGVQGHASTAGCRGYKLASSPRTVKADWSVQLVVHTIVHVVRFNT